MQCEQWKLTRILYDLLEALPQVEVRFRHRALGAVQSDDSVTLTVATPDGVESLKGRYLIAADGARSAVRKSQDIEFAGWTPPELFLVRSTPFEFADHSEGLSYVTYVSDPEEWLVLLRVPDCWRGAPHDLLDRYHRQRRTVAIEHVQAQSLRNRKLMNERDPALRRAEAIA